MCLEHWAGNIPKRAAGILAWAQLGYWESVDLEGDLQYRHNIVLIARQMEPSQKLSGRHKI